MFGYYRRRYYRRNPFSCGFSGCLTAIVGLVGGLITILYFAGAISNQDLITFIWVIGIVAVSVVVLSLVLKYGRYFKKSTKKSSSSSRTRSTTTRRTTRRARDEDEDEPDEDDRYARAPARTRTSSKSTWTPREDVTDEAPAKSTTSTRRKKASFFDNVDTDTADSAPESTVGEAGSCPKCGKANPANAKFCIECGKAL